MPAFSDLFNDPFHAAWGGARRPPVPDSQLRVSDAERQAVANTLAEHFGDGRLDQEEFNERLGTAMAAKTRADLAPLLADLPPLEPAAPPQTSRRGGFALLPIVLFVALLAGTTSAFMHPHVPWLLIGLIVFLVARRRRIHDGLGGYLAHHH